MADLSIKHLGIGLASSLLAGAISVTAATGVGASTAPTGGLGRLVRLYREQSDVGGRRERRPRLLGSEWRQPHTHWQLCHRG